MESVEQALAPKEVPSEADIALIQRVLPHRSPFLLVDKVRDIVPGKSCVGVKCVTVNEPQFDGHFPGMPIFPGVLIIEAMAQSAGVLGGLTLDLVDREGKVFFASISDAKFRRMIVPGDVMEMHIEVLRANSRIWKVSGKTMVDDCLACEAQFTAMFEASEQA